MSSRKKIDIRFKTLIENGIISNHRSMFVVVGDKGRDQIPILYHIMVKATVQSMPEVLWAYKKDLGFSSNRKKRMQLKSKKLKSKTKDLNDEDPFEIFISTTKIRYCYYEETHKILGRTFGMCVIQDFEGITPNILARTIETVSGGGLVIILLRTVKSLKQLYTMTMDVHLRYRTESHQDIIGRFNERFILSLGKCPGCLVIDDQLNILPISSSSLNIKALPPISEELKSLTSKLMQDAETSLVGHLVGCCATTDQGKAVLKLIDAIVDRSFHFTVVMTAARGRGKSAALGLSMAAAVAFGYSNIFVTAPSPENLKTMFEYICKGLTALKYSEHQDYQLKFSSNLEFNNAVVRINIYKNHRQTIQYISPEDHQMLSQAELLCIDEAAAIPLLHVTKLLGPYLVFMSSTVNGYEGTGRSLSLKLVENLRRGSKFTEVGVDVNKISSTLKEKKLHEMELKIPIRYSDKDPIEAWLTSLLCLNITNQTGGRSSEKEKSSFPFVGTCELFEVNRDTLFSFHEKTEMFLQKIVSIFVSSHYKNSPDDIQLLSDAPAHHIFVLMGSNARKSPNPDILCAVQVAYEGEISKETILNGLRRGHRGDGDMIPWIVEQEFGEREFARKSGARIVRIATNPEHQRMGYGMKALQLLQDYYEGKLLDVSLIDDANGDDAMKDHANSGQQLLEERIEPKEKLPPLLMALNQKRPETLDYLGVSYGITYPLLMFWKKFGMVPVHVGQQRNVLTGEHNCIMLKRINKNEKKKKPDWLSELFADFTRRFISLSSSDFQSWKVSLSLATLNNKNVISKVQEVSREEILLLFSQYDVTRLDRYSKNMADYRQVKDLLQRLSTLVFQGKIKLELATIKSAVLLGVGLQGKSVDQLAEELDPNDRKYPANQVLAILNQTVKCIVEKLHQILRDVEASQLSNLKEMIPVNISLDDDLLEAAESEKQRAITEHKRKLSDSYGDEIRKRFKRKNDVNFKKSKKFKKK
ncbi:hypothetical protein HELRODRAFT_110320 [Helobdella robusta]|uniref:RNA cytidine acetyltransferase n=1 Tax=Helobdella robusta TaxID=6412 RepID=T1EF13_HELRO|nr:hypothetical protein HELRODRAFT_110320 [Helobdella robusta]ESO08081.1 hypothetical protein HELRODRAFT_110320 [Helobdella robusta]